MSTISVTLPVDGSTADVADVNTPITTIVTAINGNLDNANIKSGAAIDPSKLSGGVTGMLGAWTAYTPTWTSIGTAPAIGNGTLSGAYVQLGKTVHFRLKFLAGSTTTFGTGSYRFSLPITAIAVASTSPAGGGSPATSIGTWYGENPGVIGYGGQMVLQTSTTVSPHYQNIGTSGNVLQVNQSGPGTWANGWYLMANGTYEAA